MFLGCSYEPSALLEYAIPCSSSVACALCCWVEGGGSPIAKVGEVPGACEQSFESVIAVGDEAECRINDACRACVVLEKVYERQVGQVASLVVSCGTDGHVRCRERLLVAVV
jgi:hypothetical protein